MRIITFGICLLVFVFQTKNIHAADCISVREGSFNSSGTWNCGKIPGKSDNVTIAHNISLNMNFTGENAVTGTWTVNDDKKIYATAYSLEFVSGSSLFVYGALEVKNLSFRSGSIVGISEEAEVMVHNDLKNYAGSTNVTVNGRIKTNENFTNEAGAVVSGTGTIETEEDFVNAETGTVFNLTGSSYNCHECTLTGAPLSVNLFCFAASVTKHNHVKLTWTTSCENNSDYFAVERSSNGINFYEIGRKTSHAVDGSVNYYEFTDSSPMKTLSYYHLKQMDCNGKYTLSKIVTVSDNNSPDSTSILTVYPNPCSGKCNITVEVENTEYNAVKTIEIIDSHGNIVFSVFPSGNTGKEITFQMDESHPLASGVYVVRVRYDGKEYNKKLIVK